VVLTTEEERQCRQGAVFALEALEEWRKRENVHDDMEDIEVDEREGIDSVHCFSIR